MPYNCKTIINTLCLVSLQLLVFYRAILLFRIVSKIEEFIVHLSFTLDVSLEVFETWRTCSLQSVCIGQRILHICSVFRVPLPWSIFEKAAKRVLLDIIKNDSLSYYLYCVDVILRTTFGEFNWLQLKILATAHAKRQKFLCFVSNHYAGLLHYSVNCNILKIITAMRNFIEITYRREVQTWAQSWPIFGCTWLNCKMFSLYLRYMLCYVMLCYGRLCYVRLFYVMKCCVMLCYAMKHYAMLCCVMLYFNNWLKYQKHC